MRRSVIVLLLMTIVALGAFSRLLAQAAGTGRWIPQASMLAIDRARIPVPGGLLRWLQTPAQLQGTQAAKSAATVQTDRLDYPPDAQVNVTGTGWLPREVVELTFTETATI